MRRPYRNRCCRSARASVRSLPAECPRRARAPLPRVRATDAATVRSAYGRTTAPAWRATRTGRQAARSMSRALLDHEFGGVNLSLTLDVHDDSAPSGIVVEGPRRRLCVGNRNAVDLKDHVPGLNAELLGHALRNCLNERPVRAANISLRSNRRSERHELYLAEHGDLRRVHLGKIGDLHAHRRFAFAATKNQRDVFSNAKLETFRFPVVRTVNCPIARSYQHIAALDAGARCGRSGNHRADCHSPGLNHRRTGRGRLKLDTYPRASDHTVCEKIIRHPLCSIDWNRESKSDRAAAGRIDRAVDADYFSHGVDEWTARVAGIDGCIRLDHVHVDSGTVALRRKISSGSADDSRSHTRLAVGEKKSERAADRYRPFTDQKVGRASNRSDRQIPGVDLDDGEVVCLVRTKESCGVSSSVAHGDRDLRRAGDYVSVGDDYTIVAHDEA